MFNSSIKKVIFRLTLTLLTSLILLTAALYWYLTQLNLDQYKPQIETALSKQTGAAAKITGHLHFDLYPNLALKVEQFSLSKNHASTLKASQLTIDIAFWPLLHKVIKAHIITKALSLNDLTLTTIDGHLKWQADELTIDKLTANAYQGTVQIEKTHINPLKQTISSQIAIKGLQIADLLAALKQPPLLTGKFYGHLSFASSGKSLPDFKKNLIGRLTIDLQQGKIISLDLDGITAAFKELAQKKRHFSDYLRSGLDILQKQPNFNSKNTPFDFIESEFKLKNGLATTSKILIKTKQFSVLGQGAIDYITNQLNFKLLTSLFQPPADLKKILDTLNGGIPIIIKGSTSRPKLQLDYPKVIKALQQNWLPQQDKLLNQSIQKLQKALPFKF